MKEAAENKWLELSKYLSGTLSRDGEDDNDDDDDDDDDDGDDDDNDDMDEDR